MTRCLPRRHWPRMASRSHLVGSIPPVVRQVNTKMPEVGELLLKRVVHQFRRAFKRNDKLACTAATRFVAHLVNQQVLRAPVAAQSGAALASFHTPHVCICR